MRSFLSPFVTRHTFVNQSRSLPNSAELGDTVCFAVIEYLIPYCIRLLQADILPQKLSRRSLIFMSSRRSGVACTSTGTSSFE